jgi:hypothetical protein
MNDTLGQAHHKQHVMCQQSPRRPYFHSEKSLAAKILQCAFKNVDHVVRLLRSGAGSMPFRFNTFDTVPRATL